MANPEHLAKLMEGVDAWNKWRKGKEMSGVDLSQLNLSGKDFSSANINFANLFGCVCIETNFTGADFHNANLTLVVAAKANFSHADFFGANLDRIALWNADLTEARFAFTSISSVDLRSVKGLETTQHLIETSIGIDTLYKSQGMIPDKFLRDIGSPEEIIDIARSLRAGPPIQWHSCFISYSSKDEEFARRLHSRMREANMRVWFAPEDLKGGKKLHEQLFEAIQIHDRLLIVLSEHSIQSEWVMTEIRKARATGREGE